MEVKSFVEQVLQDNEDYKVTLIQFNGLPAVKKQIKNTTPAHRAERLKNEIYAMHFLTDLVANNPQIELYVPEIYETGEGYFVREYVDGQPVYDLKKPDTANANNLEKLAKLLATIDHIGPYGETKYEAHFDYHNIRKNFPNWTKEPVTEGLITTAQLKQINKMLDKLQPYLRPRIAHGDLLPHSHAFLMANKIAFIDLENFSPAGVRYYDAVNCFNRLFRYAQSTDIAKRFLAEFMAKADRVEHQEPQLMAVMLQRVVGMQYDAWYDARKGVDYRDRAKELLDLVLQGRLELLHS